MPKTLYLCRHAQCEFNVRRKVQGWSDSPLTEHGVKQCEAAFEHIKELGIKPDAYYCSTSQRTAETLMRMTGIEEGSFTRVANLREMYFGLLEGESCDLVTAAQPLGNFLIPFGGETETQVTERMNKTIRSILDSSDTQSVFIVSHGTCSTCFKKLWKPYNAISTADELLANCGILTYEYDGEVFRLVDLWNPDVPEEPGAWLPEALVGKFGKASYEITTHE